MKHIYSLLLILFVNLSFAGDIPSKPIPPRLVNDFANIFSPQQEKQLENDLVRFSDQTTTQITVVTVESLNGYDKATFAYEIGEQWGVGDKKFNNGVVVLLKPKEIDGKGEVFIATGYGLEGVIPDAVAKRIVEVEMIPAFKQKNYYKGVLAATNTIKGLALEEYKASDYLKKHKKKKGKKGIPFGAIFFIILIIVVSRFSSARKYARRNNLPFWLALSMMSNSGRSHGGGFDSFSSGGGSFGGFGGGSFGGGGAGGDW